MCGNTHKEVTMKRIKARPKKAPPKLPEASTAVAIRQGPQAFSLSTATWEQRIQVAQTLISSGFLPVAYQKPEQVLAVMLTAKELHIPEMEALRSINVIQGKPTVSPQLMLALARRTGELKDIKFEKTASSVICVVTRKGQSPFSAEFGAKEATAMQLSNKDNYKKQPFTMYQWRALAANLRVTFGDAITGLYTPEELGAEVQITENEEQVVVEQSTLPSGNGEAREPESHSEPVTVQGASFQTFDPMVEKITFGKHQGIEWGKIPVDYLTWLAGKGRPEVKAKAEATLKALGSVHAQKDAAEGDVVDSMFPDGLGERETAGFLGAIAAAKDVDVLTRLVEKISTAKSTGEITEKQADAIRAAWNAKHKELKGVLV